MSDVSDPTEKPAAPAGANRPGKAGGRKPGAAAGKGARAGAKAGAQKPGAGKGAGARKAAVAKPAPAPVTGPAEGGTMKIREFVTRVLARSGANRLAAKPVIDAVLAELGESLARGESFVLPPLGRAKVRPTKDGAKEGVIQVRLKQGAGKKDGDSPLAPAEE